MNITEFLLARIAEDEAVARDAMREWASSEWAPASVYDDGARDVSVALDPRRLLADCNAKRRIIELHQPEYAPPTDWQGAHLSCSCNPTDEFLGADWPCPTLLAVASAYADHPDYQEEWTL